VRKSLQHGPVRLEILDKNESVVQFRSYEEALDLVKRLSADKAALGVFRRLTSAEAQSPALSDGQVLERIAAYLKSGKYRLLRSRLALSTRQGETEEQTVAEGKGPAPRKTSWIEINLRYPDGNPVPGERYRLKLPDGSVQEGNLDAYGHAEYYNINPGSCELTFPDLDADATEQA